MKLLQLQATSTVAVVNRQKIQIITENQEEYVSIRPICDALGIRPHSQIERIKRDSILAPLAKTVSDLGADGKNYQMTVLPLRYIFGWIFTIEEDLVKEGSRETILRYKKECYDVLYDHFKSYADFVNYRQQEIDDALSVYDIAKTELTRAKERMKEATELLDSKRIINYQAYLDSQLQLSMNFDEPI